jgi:precorrin-6B methylase 2
MFRPLIILFACVSSVLTVYLPVATADEEDEGEATPDVVYVATPDDIVAKMLEVVELKKDDVVYDLGCGDGRIVVTAAKKYGCRGIGFELDLGRVRQSKENAKRNGVEHLVQIERKDIFTVDLSKASVITLYLLPEMNERLLPQLNKMKPGSRVVAHDYAIEGYTPDKTITKMSKQDAVEHYIYLWKTPLKPDEEE